MFRTSLIVQLCAAGLALAQTDTAPAGPARVIECPRDQGYLPLVPALPAGEKPPATASALQPQDLLLAGGCYSEAVRKTFFAYLAAPAGEDAEARSPIRVACFDHAAGTVPRPAILPLEENGAAPNAVSLTLDQEGHIWVCASAPGRPTALFKSARPHDISSFARQAGPALSDARIFHVANQGFILIGLSIEKNRAVPCFATSPDGRAWSEPRQLAAIDAGHTLIAAQARLKTGATKIGVALAAYAADEDPSAATNVYYLETLDGGKTWQSTRRTRLDLPIKGQENAVLAFDYRSIHWTVFLKDLGFDPLGIPTVVYLGCRRSHAQAPLMCTWTTARWAGRGWETNSPIPASSAFDSTAFHIEPDRDWLQALARNGRTPPGQAKVLLMSSNDQGRSWEQKAGFEADPSQRHVLVRPAGARPELIALWILGQPGTAGRLRLMDEKGRALVLPGEMAGSEARPEPVPTTHETPQPR